MKLFIIECETKCDRNIIYTALKTFAKRVSIEDKYATYTLSKKSKKEIQFGLDSIRSRSEVADAIQLVLINELGFDGVYMPRFIIKKNKREIETDIWEGQNMSIYNPDMPQFYKKKGKKRK